MIQVENDSVLKRISDRTAWRWLAGVNGGAALISAGFAVASLIDPTAFEGGAVTALVRLSVWAYGVRAISLTAVLLFLLARRATAAALVPILVVAGLAQVGDAVIGVQVGQPGMLVGGTLLAAIHLPSAAWLHRQRSKQPVSW